MYTLFLLTVSFLISLILMPIFIWGSRKFGFVDYPNSRKVHLKPIPYLGGVAILISFAIGVLISRPIEAEYKAIILGGIVIVIVGIIDDKYDLKPGLKLIGQIAASLVPVSYGILIDRITPFGVEIEFGVLAIPITILWMVGIINAINLVDGLDGLATGVSIIALSSIGFITILQGNIFVMMICVILIGACLGFLVYNFHPAKIFLGDNGAMLLGFIISVVSLMGFKNITLISLFFPIIILAVPFIDMFFAGIAALPQQCLAREGGPQPSPPQAAEYGIYTCRERGADLFHRPSVLRGKHHPLPVHHPGVGHHLSSAHPYDGDHR